MSTGVRLTLRAADEIASSAVRTALRNRWKPITATVVDPSGNVCLHTQALPACLHTKAASSPVRRALTWIIAQIVVQKRMDGCSPAGIPAFSFAKAFTCVSMGLSSRAFRDKYTSDSQDAAKYCQMLSMVNIAEGKMAPFPVSDGRSL